MVGGPLADEMKVSVAGAARTADVWYLISTVKARLDDRTQSHVPTILYHATASQHRSTSDILVTKTNTKTQMIYLVEVKRKLQSPVKQTWRNTQIPTKKTKTKTIRKTKTTQK